MAEACQVSVRHSPRVVCTGAECVAMDWQVQHTVGTMGYAVHAAGRGGGSSRLHQLPRAVSCCMCLLLLWMSGGRTLSRWTQMLPARNSSHLWRSGMTACWRTCTTRTSPSDAVVLGALRMAAPSSSPTHALVFPCSMTMFARSSCASRPCERRADCQPLGAVGVGLLLSLVCHASCCHHGHVPTAVSVRVPYLLLSPGVSPLLLQTRRPRLSTDGASLTSWCVLHSEWVGGEGGVKLLFVELVDKQAYFNKGCCVSWCCLDVGRPACPYRPRNPPPPYPLRTHPSTHTHTLIHSHTPHTPHTPIFTHIAHPQTHPSTTITRTLSGVLFIATRMTRIDSSWKRSVALCQH